MNLNSKKISFGILGVTAIIFSRLMFVFFNDPEGPNLLVVAAAAAAVYLVSLVAYVLPSVPDSKKFLIALLIQIVLVVGLTYFGLK